MSLLRSFLAVRAVRDGRAQPAATVRHAHLSAEPLVFVPLRMAGESAAPLAAMVGASRSDARLLVVENPRNRDQRFAFMAELAEIIVPYIQKYAAQMETVEGRSAYERCLDAPQILVPNPGGLAFTRLIGRSTRFRATEGPHAVAPLVPLLGRWLTFLHERSEFAGSAILLAVTDLLAEHWVTGLSGAEAGNLAAQLAWIDPPGGLTGPQAALLAEDPLRSPPAGPDTDPGFDTHVLKPLLDGPPVPARLREALRGQLEPTWELMWRAVELLRAVPDAGGVAARWERDRTMLARQHAWIAEGGLPPGRWDSAVAAARRLAALEGAQQSYEAGKAFDDPLVMAEHRAEGAAFAGLVTDVDADRKIIPPGGKRAVARPLVTVRTADPVRFPPGRKLLSPARPKQGTVLVSATDGVVVLQVNSGMTKDATLPAPGETVCYTDLDPAGVRRPSLPDAAETPWTHGGPPAEYVPTDEDAQEAWS
ncbi:hypothetical protein Aph01nite_72600 [Acrocarpospora phusangensis]|uniref:Uncharacterized protein n=1 Tax=Acrocarpospora phusangensis TaxID=1070424 RepID=A0A919QK65_9ACTN|nr:hypothetical protein [Acrocarpospora phusangensis]GIH28950.1 hypothetical protein Aph01nite_72600 [Acrocarpospora phusangensis]